MRLRQILKTERAAYGPQAYKKYTGGVLPTQYPRIMGPNALKYLQEVVDSGLDRGGKDGTMVE